MEERFHLKQNVLAEPLFNQWYAWSCLISPPTAAMLIANSHLKIMQSFVSNPQVHISALKNPKMSGGPFINYDAGAVGLIKELLEKTTREQAHMLRLAEAIKSADELLAGEADGSSLEPLYQKIPDALRGYVELVYDLNNHPSLRFIEGLLYRSPYNDTSSQSIALSIVERDERPFVYSTPRLEREDTLLWNVPFKDGRVDELFKTKSTPQPLGYIKEVLGLNGKAEKLTDFLTPQAPERSPAFAGDGVRVRYFGHACLLVETRGVSIITDPLISYKHGSGIPRLTYADLPERIDHVVITHNHQDHFMLESLLQLRHKIKHVIVPKNNGGSLADPSLKLMLKSVGFSNVTEIDELETIKVEGGAITSLPFLGEHADLNIRSKTSYLINLQNKAIVCAADSNSIEARMYDHLHEITGDIDVLFLGMECDGAPLTWIYGSLLTRPLARKQDQSRRLNGSDYEKAITIVDKLRPRQVYVYAMGQEPWLTFVTAIQYTEDSRPIVESNRLIECCRSRGITSERLFGSKEIILGAD